mgnify:CR=1 FL=1
MENAPDSHDLIADDVEHQVRKTSQRPDAQARNFEFVGESQASRLRRSTDRTDGPLDGVHESQRDFSVRPGEVVINDLIDVGRGPLAKSDGPDGHDNQASDRMRSRTDVKYVASATGPGDDAAPSRRTRRSC